MTDSIDRKAGEKPAKSDKSRIITEHLPAAIGLAFGIALLYPDVKSDKFSVFGAFGIIVAVVLFFIDLALSTSSATDKILNNLEKVGSAVSDNTHTLKAHQLLLASRITDNLTLFAFKNLLAYLPFYLAEDLGYFKDQHIVINKFTASLDDQNTARLLLENASNSIAICDPYMCVTNPGLRMVYPICTGIAAWPMTLNWIGSTAALNKQVRIAAYKAPSTTHVLAQFVKQHVITPLLPVASGVTASVVGLKDEEAQFGESDIRETGTGRGRRAAGDPFRPSGRSAGRGRRRTAPRRPGMLGRAAAWRPGRPGWMRTMSTSCSDRRIVSRSSINSPTETGAFMCMTNFLGGCLHRYKPRFELAVVPQPISIS